MKKSLTKKSNLPDAPHSVALGNTVLIQRPHLWSMCRGVVVKHVDGGLHRVMVFGKMGNVFHADCPGDQLCVDNCWQEIELL